MKKLLIILYVLFLFSLNLFSQGKKDKAPEFALVDINDEVIKLSQFRGSLVVLDFWATWCPPCRAEIPSFVELHNRYKNSNVAIIGISVDDPKKANTVKKFVLQNDMKYPVLFATGKVVKDYGGIRAIPTTFIIDENGIILEKHIGYTEKEVFESYITDFLNRKIPEKQK